MYIEDTPVIINRQWEQFRSCMLNRFEKDIIVDELYFNPFFNIKGFKKLSTKLSIKTGKYNTLSISFEMNNNVKIMIVPQSNFESLTSFKHSVHFVKKFPGELFPKKINYTKAHKYNLLYEMFKHINQCKLC